VASAPTSAGAHGSQEVQLGGCACAPRGPRSSPDRGAGLGRGRAANVSAGRAQEPRLSPGTAAHGGDVATTHGDHVGMRLRARALP
jgi:hypothetical protein